MDEVIQRLNKYELYLSRFTKLLLVILYTYVIIKIGYRCGYQGAMSDIMAAYNESQGNGKASTWNSESSQGRSSI